MAVNGRQKMYLDAMGIQSWSLRNLDIAPEIIEADATPVVPAVQNCATVSNAEKHINTAIQDTWQRLEYQVDQCTACDLHQQRKQTVFGIGHQQADWFIVGEAPGGDEDRHGTPFVGPAGKMLDAMLSAIGLSRGQVYLSNTLKCRPPANRAPRSQEIAQCQIFLQQQLALIQPQIILVMGANAAQQLLDTTATLAQLRGQLHSFGDPGIPLVVTYHPAYLLRAAKEKRRAWQDLQLAHQHILTLNTSG